MSETLSSRLSWCPLGMGVRDTSGNITFSPSSTEEDNDSEQEHNLLTNETSRLGCIYMPMENLLVRSFQLPLDHIKYLDAPMLAQELADTAGIEPNDWWLTWHASKTERGISGIVFGLPKTEKHRIQTMPAWQQAPLLLVDGWERLNQQLQGNTEQASIAVIDTDAEGVFFGFYQAGVWKGMRRLNGDMQTDEIATSLSKQALWSLASMGFDPESSIALGRITTPMKNELHSITHQSSLMIEDSLPQRYMANLTLPNPNSKGKNTLNIRHGKWAIKRKDTLPREWHRPALLAAAACCLWLILTTFGNHQLESQLESMNDDITSAFHKGLPNQPVIIDALAQLRQAANQGGGTPSGSAFVTSQLNSLGEVFKTNPWDMQELKMDDKGSSLAGKVDSLDTLNTIRKLLEDKLGRTVQIADTDLNGNKVAFRMTWP
jgi:hypothetical protein